MDIFLFLVQLAMFLLLVAVSVVLICVPTVTTFISAPMGQDLLMKVLVLPKVEIVSETFATKCTLKPLLAIRFVNFIHMT